MLLQILLSCVLGLGFNAAYAICSAVGSDINFRWDIYTDSVGSSTIHNRMIVKNETGTVAFLANGWEEYITNAAPNLFDITGGDLNVTSACGVTGFWTGDANATWTIRTARMSENKQIIMGVVQRQIGSQFFVMQFTGVRR